MKIITISIIVLILLAWLIGCSSTSHTANEYQPIQGSSINNSTSQPMKAEFTADLETGVIAYTVEASINGGATWSNLKSVTPLGAGTTYSVSIPVGTGLYRVRTTFNTSSTYTNIINVP